MTRKPQKLRSDAGRCDEDTLILIDRYWKPDKTTAQLAADMGIQTGALRARILRLRRIGLLKPGTMGPGMELRRM